MHTRTMPAPQEMDESGLRFLVAIMKTETATFIDEQDFAAAEHCARRLADLCAELTRRLPPQESSGY